MIFVLKESSQAYLFENDETSNMEKWQFLRVADTFSQARKVHFPDLEVGCDWSTFFPLKSADVSGAGTRDEPLRKSA